MADQKLEKELESLRKDLKTLQDDMKKAVGSGGDAVAAARAKLEAEADRLMQNLSSAASGVRDQGTAMLETVEGKIEEKPLATVLTTFGIGFVIGWLIGRK